MTFKRTLNNSREIYVLRGIAIIFVFAYHLNIPGFSNGFVGVDIFLVSSGFLIHHIISQNPEFNITDFLLNRIRRIYPALLLTILLTILLFPYLLNQQEMRLHINSIIPAVVSFSNIYFSQNFDYFLSDNSTFPLLHLWSISLEFQFYLFIGLIYVVLPKKSKIRTRLIYVILLASFLYFTYLFFISENTKIGYFSPFSRIWEFLLGYILFYLVQKKYILKDNRIFVFTSIIFCLGFFLLQNTPYKISLNIMLSVVFTVVALIHFSSKELNSIFFFAPEKLGLLSYTMYLTHWPIIVGLKKYGISDIDLWIKSILTTILVSIFIYTVFERPIWKKIIFRKNSFLITGLLVFTFIIFILVRYLDYNNDSGIHNKRTNPLYNEWQPDLDSYYFKMLKVGDRDSTHLGYLGSSANSPTFLLLGDSHAEMYVPVFDKLVKEFKITGAVATLGECPPILKNTIGRQTLQCPNFLRDVIEQEINNSGIKTVFLGASWGAYYKEGIPKGKFIESIDGFRTNSMEDFYSDTIQMVNFLNSKGIQYVYIIGPTPVFDVSITDYLKIKGDNVNSNLNSPLYINSQDYLVKHRTQLIAFEKLQLTSGIKILEPYKNFCSDSKCSAIMSKNNSTIPLFFDSNHLTKEGALITEDIFRSSFEDTLP